MKIKSLLLTAVASLGFTATTMAQVPNYVPSNGLVGWWPFSGNANDESGNGNNGTVNGATLSIDRFGDANSTFSFNGVDNKILFNLNSISNSFPLNTESTSSIWVKSIDQNGPLISMQGIGGIEYLLHIGTLADIIQSPGNFGMLVRDNCCGTGNNIFGSSVVDNNWHMLTIVRLGNGTLLLYKDGILQASSPAGQSGTLTFNPTTMAFGADESWIIGAQSGNCNSCNSVDQRHFSGLIDDAGIWNRALTQQEITALFNAQSCTASITAAGPTTFCQGGSVVLNANTGTGLTYQWKNNGNNISGATAASYSANTAGSYTVVVTDGNGCSATSTATTIAVNPTPNATITAAGPTTFCQGGSVVLNANTGTGLTYQWKNNGNNISGATAASYTANTAGSYTVVVTNGNGCSATSTATSVTVNPTPNATITAAGPTTFCQGGSVVLNANTATGLIYQWKNNGNNISGATAASYTANTAGAYTVVVTNGNGCSATSTATTITVNPTPTLSILGLGSFTNINANQISIIVNPNGGLLTGPGISGAAFNPQSAGLGSATINYSYTNTNGCNNTASQTTIVYDTLGVVCTSYDTITTNVFDTTYVTQIVYDTLLTTVTDTLLINALITGINPPNNSNTIKVFPNPANDHITIDYGNFNLMVGYQLKIENAIGQQVFQTSITQQADYLSLTTWGGNGLYFVRIIDPQGITIDVRKIVLQ